jgi:hypothetical protein
MTCNHRDVGSTPASGTRCKGCEMTVTDADELIILDNEILPSFNQRELCYLCDREIPAREHVLDFVVGVLCSRCARKAADRLDYLNTYGETN